MARRFQAPKIQTLLTAYGCNPLIQWRMRSYEILAVAGIEVAMRDASSEKVKGQ
jgi:hypothetical protein